MNDAEQREQQEGNESCRHRGHGLVLITFLERFWWFLPREGFFFVFLFHSHLQCVVVITNVFEKLEKDGACLEVGYSADGFQITEKGHCGGYILWIPLLTGESMDHDRGRLDRDRNSTMFFQLMEQLKRKGSTVKFRTGLKNPLRSPFQRFAKRERGNNLRINQQFEIKDEEGNCCKKLFFFDEAGSGKGAEKLEMDRLLKIDLRKIVGDIVLGDCGRYFRGDGGGLWMEID